MIGDCWSFEFTSIILSRKKSRAERTLAEQVKEIPLLNKTKTDPLHHLISIFNSSMLCQENYSLSVAIYFNGYSSSSLALTVPLLCSQAPLQLLLSEHLLLVMVQNVVTCLFTRAWWSWLLNTENCTVWVYQSNPKFSCLRQPLVPQQEYSSTSCTMAPSCTSKQSEGHRIRGHYLATKAGHRCCSAVTNVSGMGTWQQIAFHKDFQAQFWS